MHITEFTTEPLNTVLAHRAKGVKAEAVMFDLADKYGLSYGAVNKIVHAQR